MQRQLDAYNARDLARFVACYAAALLGRMVFGNKVIDQERSVGLGEQPVDAAAVYEVNADGMITAVWFFSAD